MLIFGSWPLCCHCVNKQFNAGILALRFLFYCATNNRQIQDVCALCVCGDWLNQKALLWMSANTGWWGDRGQGWESVVFSLWIYFIPVSMNAFTCCDFYSTYGAETIFHCNAVHLAQATFLKLTEQNQTVDEKWPSGLQSCCRCGPRLLAQLLLLLSFVREHDEMTGSEPCVALTWGSSFVFGSDLVGKEARYISFRFVCCDWLCIPANI